MSHVLTRMARGERGLTFAVTARSRYEAHWRKAATRLGIPFEEYHGHRQAGEKWCSGHRAWHVLAETPFAASRGALDGLASHCKRHLREYWARRRRVACSA